MQQVITLPQIVDLTEIDTIYHCSFKTMGIKLAPQYLELSKTNPSSPQSKK